MKIGNIIYYPLKAVWLSYSIIPLPVLYFISDLLYFPLYYLIRYRKKVVRRNLMESFPEKNLKEIKHIEKGFYHHFLNLICEMCKFATISEKGIKKRMKFENIDEISDVLDNGESISLYLGHYGCWEWVSSMPLYFNKDVVAAQIYRRLTNKTVDKLLLKNRSRLGAVNVEMKGVPRWIKNQIDDKKVTITGYIADQSPRMKDQQHYVRFLQHEVPAFVGSEKITKRYGMKAWFLDIRRVKRGYYEGRFIEMNEDPKSLPDYELTDIYYKLLEEMIRRKPELYLWSHKRFRYAKKTMPDETK